MDSEPFGGEWIRFSYAKTVERTAGAFDRLVEGLNSLKSSFTAKFAIPGAYLSWP
jgi:hypothetical protein